MNKITIKKNPNGDTRTAPKNISFKKFHEANQSHINDVFRVMWRLSEQLYNQGLNHDHTKLDYEKEFYNNFLDTMNNGTDFVSNTWHQKHIHEERHHPSRYCHEDINLLDIIEMVADCVCAGKARSGEVRPLEIDPEILKKAFDNTAKLVDEMTELEE